MKYHYSVAFLYSLIWFCNSLSLSLLKITCPTLLYYCSVCKLWSFRHKLVFVLSCFSTSIINCILVWCIEYCCVCHKGQIRKKNRLALKSLALCNNYLSPSYTQIQLLFLSQRPHHKHRSTSLSLTHKCRAILLITPPPPPPKNENCQSTYPEPDGVGGDREPVPIMCDQQVGNRLWFTAFHRPWKRPAYHVSSVSPFLQTMT